MLAMFAAALLMGPAQTAPARAAAAAPTTHTVVIAGMKFVPESLTVRRGDTVRWVNEDFFPHTATASNRSFDSGNIGTNEAWAYVAKQDGTFAYVCTLHPTMKGTLIVE
jgi:plastocyanin